MVVNPYFLHGKMLRNNKKVQRLRYEKGILGYAVYILILEYALLIPKHEIKYSDIHLLSNEFEVPENFLNLIITKYDLFELKENSFVVKYYKVCNVNKNNKSRLYNTNVKLWYKIRNAIFIRDNYTCHYCGSVGGKLEADHIMPVSKGGGDLLDNLVTSCRKCNRQKRDKSYNDFILWKNKV